MSLNELTIKEASMGLRSKEFTCVELLESCLSQIKNRDTELHAFLTVLEESSMATAKKVDERIAKGLSLKTLEGVPVALKDNMLVQGTITTAGSKILENYCASYSASVVDALQKDGAIILGKTNMDDAAMGSSTESSYFGPTKNPWDTSRVPGGSSGGSAAAVAADLCIAALGSDTGGSIRQPAALCGVAGFKPTYGSVSRYGLIAMASSLDQIGPFGKTVEDAALLFDAIKGADPRDSSSAKASAAPTAAQIKHPIKGLRIGIPREYFIDGMDTDVEKAVRDAIEILRHLGAEIADISLPHAKYGLAVYYIIMPAEVSANISRLDGIRYGYSAHDATSLLETYTKSREEGLGPEVRRRIMLGTYTLAAGYYDAYYKQAQKVRMLVTRDFSNAFLDVDCIITPTTPSPAFKIGEKTADPLAMYLEDVFTVSANISGVPALSVPCGYVQRDGKELPVGLQIFGKHFDDATVLRVGHTYEQATEWRKRKSSR
ncbi:Asp-tRNA(Asn)/Glu-tRNA(Gln) amidotransferase subunit GatA [Candidatus Uhrbacteria bacterium]|nr:Asp-tRNA(Asn)/Glu-tRNA(Gln) amidotransferase subunit GatA [Candidatus Uhrbacteria bacterium]